MITSESEVGVGQAEGTLKWIIGKCIVIIERPHISHRSVAIHDAFETYGRPDAWTWDRCDPASLMFACPVGPHNNVVDVTENSYPKRYLNTFSFCS